MAFAASQVDWKHLQQQHVEVWLQIASKAFSQLDKDQDGVLKMDEIINVLRCVQGRSAWVVMLVSK